MGIILFVLCALLLLILASGVYVFLVGCVRKKDLLWLVEEEIRKTAYGKYYEHIVAADRWLKDQKAQDVYVTSKDGLRLHGLWVPAQNSKGTILLVHGYRSTMLADFGPALDFYHKYGLNLLIPEQRCHGKSQGKFITFGVKESGDMLQWIAFHNTQHGSLPMILSGLSMGASTVMYLADEGLPVNVKGLIADCGFTSPKEILSSVFKRVIHLPAWPTIVVTDLVSRLVAGFSLSQKDTRLTLRKNRLPIVLVHGVADGFVPCEMTKEAYEVCAGPKQLLLVEGADHGVSFLVDKKRYTDTIIAFLHETIDNQ